MQRRPLSALALAGAFIVLMPLARAAANAPLPQDGVLDRREARAWLLRVHDAASHRNFQGTFVVTSGGSVSSARIVHYCDERNQYERIDTMDGQLRRVFRHNDVVHTLWPQSHVAMVEQRDQMSSFPALLQGGDVGIADVYEMHALGSERVAGHEANVLQLKSTDAYRYGYRLWAEKSTGLLLRSEVLGPHEEVLESSAFSNVALNVKTQPESVLQPMAKLEGYRVVRQTLMPTRLETEGWSLRSPIDGFKLVSSVKRPLDGAMEPQPEGSRGSPSPQVLQSIFSDGLTYVSVFIEAYDPHRHRQPIQASSGATHTMMRRQGESWWITVVGDVPALTLQSFADALERKTK